MGEWMENENLVDWNKVWWLDEKKWFRALALQAKNNKEMISKSQKGSLDLRKNKHVILKRSMSFIMLEN